MSDFRRIFLRAGAAAVAAALLALLASCSTINRLDRYELEGSTLRADMRMPPAPSMDIDYSVTFDSRNPIGTAISVGTNVFKASEAKKAEAVMRQALTSVDVPGIVLDNTSQSFASSLAARLVERGQKAEYLLDLDLYEYGIQAPSWASAVSLHLGMTAIIYHNPSGDIVWRRKHFTVDVPASPQMFGAGLVVSDIVTAAVLSTLTVEQLEEGFRALALETSRFVTRTLEDDYYKARYR